MAIEVGFKERLSFWLLVDQGTPLGELQHNCVMINKAEQFKPMVKKFIRQYFPPEGEQVVADSELPRLFDEAVQIMALDQIQKLQATRLEGKSAKQGPASADETVLGAACWTNEDPEVDPLLESWKSDPSPLLKIRPIDAVIQSIKSFL